MFTITMSTVTRGACVLLIVLCVGCATGGPAEEPLTIVQSIQVGDDALDCDSLQGQIFDAETIVSRLTQSIDAGKTTARMTDASSAINNYLGQSNMFNSLLGNSARDKVSDEREIRDSYQRRRDILLQQYMHKKCSVRSEEVAPT